MGNLCGKPSKESDPFSQPGRALGSAPPPQSTRVSVPKVNSQGQKLGGSSAKDGSDARSAAAWAAEVCRSSPLRGSLQRGNWNSRFDTDKTRTVGASQSKSAKREARQGFGEREGTDKGWDLGEYKPR